MQESLSFQPKQELRKLPVVSTQSEWLIPGNINLLINDLNLNPDQQQQIQQQLSRQVEFLEPSLLSNTLTNILSRNSNLFENKKLAVLYPKRGGLIVRQLLSLSTLLPVQYYQEYNIDSSRSQPKSFPAITLPNNLINRLKSGDFDSILIIDDVIVSGLTIQEIQSKVYQQTDIVDETRYIPELRFSWDDIEIDRLPLDWYAAAWLTYAKPGLQLNQLPSFNQVLTGVYYKGEKGQTPLNSLSTWIYDDKKGTEVLQAYAQKYASNPQQFISFINQLQL